MIRLSVNVNKVATLRNSRGGAAPSVVEAAGVCLAAGAGGITVHPRADERHITPQDVRDVARLLRERGGTDVEYNVEGDPRPEWLALVHEVRPHQATLVPVRPGEVTSEAGWPADTDGEQMRRWVAGLRQAGIRVSLFVDPTTDAIRWASQMGADRVELYTGPFAHAFAADGGQALYQAHAQAAQLAHELGLGINAGHDLDLENLPLFRQLPNLAEVSIGHALMSHALFVGLERAVRDYRAVLDG